jgi:hypothetical protein
MRCAKVGCFVYEHLVHTESTVKYIQCGWPSVDSLLGLLLIRDTLYAKVQLDGLRLEKHLQKFKV